MSGSWKIIVRATTDIQEHALLSEVSAGISNMFNDFVNYAAAKRFD